MSRPVALLILFAAAVLEAGGDAVVRAGIHTSQIASRVTLFLLGGCILFAYGWVVNAPPWDFGKLLGIYVTLFFVVAQIVNFIFFGARPDLPIFVGGALIVTGGLVITFWRAS